MIQEAEFRKDVSGHQLKVLRDDGVYRHLRFAKGDSSTHAFDLLTYPGGLLIRGDMGCFVFERTDDMFRFFRDDGGSRINASYWAEKVKAQSIFGDGVKTYSPEEAKAIVEAELSDCDRLSQKGYEEVMDFLSDAFDSEEELLNAMARWDVHGDYKDEFQFDTSCGQDFRVYTIHFLWCLHAIVWGIEQYDQRGASCAQ